jgi:hypothetical protein
VTGTVVFRPLASLTVIVAVPAVFAVTVNVLPLPEIDATLPLSIVAVNDPL